MEKSPIAIIEDRYAGVYSGGYWLAVASSTDVFDDGLSRVQFCLESEHGPYGSDVDAGTFWINPPAWIAVGSKPDEALQKLRNF